MKTSGVTSHLGQEIKISNSTYLERLRSIDALKVLFPWQYLNKNTKCTTLRQKERTIVLPRIFIMLRLPCTEARISQGKQGFDESRLSLGEDSLFVSEGLFPYGIIKITLLSKLFCLFTP